MFRAKGEPGLREAMHWTPLPGGAVRCDLCGHRCAIQKGGRGRCGVRENRNGKLFTLIYGMYAYGWTVDPIEKKPFFHFMPGTRALSLGTAGCNFRCLQCQNHEMSHAKPPVDWLYPTTPEEVVEKAGLSLAESVAWTYNEPTIWHEFALDSSKLVKKTGKAVSYVTNGYIEEAPLRELAPYLDAMNIDVKGFTEKFYTETCGSKLEKVKQTCVLARELGIHVELTYLIIPSLNDSAQDLGAFAKWAFEAMGQETPIHFSRFHPDNKLMTLERTPRATLALAHDTARKAGMRYVYVGNAPELGLEDTKCPHCGATVIERWGFVVKSRSSDLSKCPGCGKAIPVVMKPTK